MFNFNLPKKEKISKEKQNIFELYSFFLKNEKMPNDFVEICNKLSVVLEETPDNIIISSEIKNKIQDAILYIVQNLRNTEEYGTEADNRKKEVVMKFEILAKEYFDSLKNIVDVHVSMDAIENAWRNERGAQ